MLSEKIIIIETIMTINNNLNAVLFDLDGTLFDTAPDLAFALNITLKNNGFAPLPLETIRSTISVGTIGMLKQGLPFNENHNDFQRIRLEFLKIYQDHLADQTILFDGMLSVLDTIESHQLKWGVVTNKPTHFSQALMQHFKLDTHAACLVGADRVTQPKPAPDGLLLACELMKIFPNQCVYVGDAKADVEAARAASMPIITALYGYITKNDDPQSWQADYTINTPADLLPLLF